ncbi:MAG: hypothetical protein ACNA70_07670 [Brevefilum sp.]
MSAAIQQRGSTIKRWVMLVFTKPLLWLTLLVDIDPGTHQRSEDTIFSLEGLLDEQSI